MIIFSKASDLSVFLEKNSKKDIGFVPTMGALHPGHLSLLQIANQQSELIVSSIFVNPTQFNDPSDFKKYPKTIENDLALLEKSDCHVVFIPSVDEMYPSGIHQKKLYDLGYLENILEGKYRPGHFQGVCQVVERLLEIVNPNKLFLGQKDYQQCMVIERLINLTSQNTIIVKVPTKRGSGGLALSSRNALLNEEEKKIAENLYRSLQLIVEKIKQVSFAELEKVAINFLLENGFSKADYITIANAKDLSPVEKWDENIPLVIVVAAFIGNVRLIDNIIINS